jgi:hypothetical protein
VERLHKDRYDPAVTIGSAGKGKSRQWMSASYIQGSEIGEQQLNSLSFGILVIYI